MLYLGLLETFPWNLLDRYLAIHFDYDFSRDLYIG
jgi:hypothetical protein